MNQGNGYTVLNGEKTGLSPWSWAILAIVGTAACLVGISVVRGLIGGAGIGEVLGQLLQSSHLGLAVLVLFPILAGGMAWWAGWRLNRQQHQTSELDALLKRTHAELTCAQGQLEAAHEEIAAAKEKFLRTTTRMRLRLSRMLSPSPDPKRVDLLDIIDCDIVQDLQDAFASAFGLGSEVRDVASELLTQPSGRAEVCRVVQSTPLGRQECFWFVRNIVEKAASRKQPVYKRCPSCGLMCGGSPLLVDEHHLATWMAGQVRIDEIDEAALEAKAVDLGISFQTLLAACRKAPVMALGTYQSALQLLWFITKEISSMGYRNQQLAHEAILRKRAERESSLSWHALEQIPEGIVLVGANGKIMFANDAFCQQIGCQRTELIERRMSELRPEGITPEVDFPGDGSSGPVKLRRPGGAEVALTIVRSDFSINGKTFLCFMTTPADRQVATGSLNLSDY